METDDFVRSAGEGDLEAVKRFIDAGSNPNARNVKGSTALIAAAKQGRKEVVAFLLKNGAEVDGEDSEFKGTALIWAALNGHTETVGLLLEKGAEPEAREKKNGMTALHSAAVKGHTDTVKLILEQGAMPNDLNVKSSQRLCVILSLAVLIYLAVASWREPIVTLLPVTAGLNTWL